MNHEENSIDIERSSVRLREIFILFFKIGVMSFGGGLSAWIYREVVEEKRWLTASDLLSGIAHFIILALIVLTVGILRWPIQFLC